MNFKQEVYPEDLLLLTKSSYEIANYLEKGLNSYDCPSLSDLYETKGNRVLKKKYVFQKYGYDFDKGLYVFGENIDGTVKPVYIGISRRIDRRLRQHGWGKSHNTATLAFLIAPRLYFNRIKIPGFKYDFSIPPRNRESINGFSDVKKAKEHIMNFKVAIYPIESDYELYFHEVAIAGILKTKWNSFKTH